jgi:hypothetical protein
MRFCAFLLAAVTALAADAPTDILEAARKGNSKGIETLLSKGSDIEARDKDGRTPLMLAAQYGRTASVQVLLEKGANAAARDTHHWDAFMLALLAPSGGVVHTTHDAVLKLLPPPKRFRVTITASWAPGKGGFTSCFMRSEELKQHLRDLHPDGIVIEALQHFAPTSGRDLIVFVSADARGNSEISERPTPKDVDAILNLQVEPGIACVQQADQVSLAIQAALSTPEKSRPLLEKSFGAAVRTGMRGQVATNPNQHEPLLASWAKSQAGPLYWAVLTALLLD